MAEQVLIQFRADKALHEQDAAAQAAGADYAAPAANSQAGTEVALPMRGNDSEVKAEGLERLTSADYLPQVAAQDFWYRLILQVFASEPAVQAVLFKVACSPDPQDSSHWVFYVDQHDQNEDLLLLPSIMLRDPKYKDLVPYQGESVANSDLFWLLLQKRIENALNINLTVSVVPMNGVPNNSPLKLAEFYARQDVEKRKGELMQVQGLNSLLSMFGEDLQTADVELYRQQQKDDKPKTS